MENIKKIVLLCFCMVVCNSNAQHLGAFLNKIRLLRSDSLSINDKRAILEREISELDSLTEKESKSEAPIFGLTDDLSNHQQGISYKSISSKISAKKKTISYPNGDKYVGEVNSRNKKEGTGTMYYASGTVYVGQWKNDEENGFGTKTWYDGDKYEGQFLGGNQNGYGVYIWTDGNKYEGQFQNGCINGHGVYIWTDGSKYVGEWKDGRQHGKGIYTYKNGGEYNGDFVNGEMRGNGTFTWLDGAKYIGEFKDWYRNGAGTMEWANGNKYIGEWKDDKPNGQGTMYFRDGGVYSGEWKDGYRTGYGICDYPEGDRYEGEWSSNTPSGQGKAIYVNGDIYIGEWYNGNRQGYGTFYSKDGWIYKGRFNNDVFFANDEGAKTDTIYYKEGVYIGSTIKNKGKIVPNGKGVFIYSDVCSYMGTFEKGVKNGMGTYTTENSIHTGFFKNGLPNGEGELEDIITHIKYKGLFKNGKLEGKAECLYPDGTKLEGTFRKGLLNGAGSAEYANNEVYKGNFKNGKYHGQGVYYYADGSSYKGNFKEGARNGSGTLTLANNDYYIGKFKNDKFNGTGYFHWHGGGWYKGNFSDGEQTGKGYYKFPDGDSYKGEFYKGTFEGKGTYRSDGEFVTGYWEDGELVKETNSTERRRQRVANFFNALAGALATAANAYNATWTGNGYSSFGNVYFTSPVNCMSYYNMSPNMSYNPIMEGCAALVNQYNQACVESSQRMGLTYTPTPSMYSNSISYQTSSNSNYSFEVSSQGNRTQCFRCDGKKTIVKNDNVTFGQNGYCDICSKTVYGGHYHIECPECKGKGYK